MPIGQGVPIQYRQAPSPSSHGKAISGAQRQIGGAIVCQAHLLMGTGDFTVLSNVRTGGGEKKKKNTHDKPGPFKNTLGLGVGGVITFPPPHDPLHFSAIHKMPAVQLLTGSGAVIGGWAFVFIISNFPHFCLWLFKSHP